RLRIIEIIKAQVQRAPAGDGGAIRPDWLPIGEKNGNGHVGVTFAGIEDAGGLVRDQLAIGIRAFGGNISLRNRPSPAADGLHSVPPLPTKVDNSDDGFFVSSGREHFSPSGVEVLRTAFSGKPARSYRAKVHRGRRGGPIEAVQDSDARNHGFARHPPFGEARGCARTGGVGWLCFGAQFGSRGLRD